ncbi:Glycosyl hydrolases family 18 [Austwickia chelonae]|uniref:GH18 domain-containing protein n=1 Tax=Austwickia chelonae NBRC 105200 TaxID=1184607 RepID=K6V9J3_9MICO|nr:endo-beta-N-acetylglucosaminidase H [Austwickia chelonae]GAB78903.1 hypothetical protein AUCHE_17_01150 [Austwickia chelonae NBRC 105200]SEV86206.1 Glycosyl hydrolases family 18 [Austwickia chelonae]
MAAHHPTPTPSLARTAPPTRMLTALVAALLVMVGTMFAPPPAQASSDRKHKSVVYVEVNSNELANAGKYQLANGGKAFDVAIIFAANINSGTDGNAVLHLNERVKWTLENAETQIRPLQAKGTKVTLSLLGNHQKAGFANFPNQQAAAQFATQVAQVVKQYGLDGVDIDDEWVSYGRNGVPAANDKSAVWLVESLREQLPQDSIVSLYYIGAAAAQLRNAPNHVADKISYVCNPHYGTYSAPPFPRDMSRVGAAAIDFSRQSASTISEFAQRTANDGYGYFVTYNLTAGDHSAAVSAFTQKLYGQRAVYQG